MHFMWDWPQWAKPEPQNRLSRPIAVWSGPEAVPQFKALALPNEIRAVVAPAGDCQRVNAQGLRGRFRCEEVQVTVEASVWPRIV